MIVDPGQATLAELYRLLISVIVPRPIAFVSTRGADGAHNLAPFSFFTALSSEPPLVGVSIQQRAGDPKDTLRNVRETGEFVVNVCSEPLLERMVRTSGDWPRGTSEFTVAGLTPAASLRVGAPSVAESPVQLECRLEREIPLGNSVLVVGEVLLVRVRDDVVVDGQVEPSKLAAVGRLGGESYAPLREVARVKRPRVSRVTGEVSR